MSAVQISYEEKAARSVLDGQGSCNLLGLKALPIRIALKCLSAFNRRTFLYLIISYIIDKIFIVS